MLHYGALPVVELSPKGSDDSVTKHARRRLSESVDDVLEREWSGARDAFDERKPVRLGKHQAPHIERVDVLFTGFIPDPLGLFSGAKLP